MLEAFTVPRNRNRTFILLAICGVLASGAAVVEIDDNPPGLLLAFLSSLAFIVAFVHPWRTTRNFQILMLASGLGLVGFGLFHNAFHGLASVAGSSGLAHDLLSGAGVIFFLIAVLLCPPAFLVGAVGANLMSRRERSSTDTASQQEGDEDGSSGSCSRNRLCR